MDFGFLHLDNLIVMILSAGSIYGAIRSDIKNMHERIERVEVSTDESRRRIDNILMNNHE